MLNAFRHHRNSHPAFAAAFSLALKCSTPFGITGTLTSTSAAARSESLGVLNAFRHHRNSHTLAQVDSRWLTRVLNAFRHHRNSNSLCCTNSAAGPGAQRLSASQELSQNQLTATVQQRRVLNAFRHHRNSHGDDAQAVLRTRAVLNAFRHHRNSHRPQFGVVELLALCSTPFGITGTLT